MGDLGGAVDWCELWRCIRFDQVEDVADLVVVSGEGTDVDRGCFGVFVDDHLVGAGDVEVDGGAFADDGVFHLVPHGGLVVPGARGSDMDWI